VWFHELNPSLFKIAGGRGSLPQTFSSSRNIWQSPETSVVVTTEDRDAVNVLQYIGQTHNKDWPGSGGVTQVVQRLPSKYEGLSSNATKKKKK
jgi:hypothetical protein